MSCRVPVFCLYICMQYVKCMKVIFRFLRKSLEIEEKGSYIFRICLEIHVDVL